MAHNLYTPEQAARATLARLRYMSVLPRTVRQDFSGEFIPGRGHVVNVRGPVTVSEARTYTRTNRADRDGIVFDDLTETTYPVTMDTQVYKGVRLPDDFATFTLEDMNRQVLVPQADSVVRGVTDRLHAVMERVDTDSSIPLINVDGSNAFAAIRAARRVLNSREVPLDNRYLAVGAGVEDAILSVDQLLKVNEAGSSDALRRATIGRLLDFEVVVEPRLPAYMAVAYVRDAFTLVTRPSRSPDGAAASAVVARDGFSLRWLRQYNPNQLEDQSIVDTFVGAQVLDAERAALIGLKLSGNTIKVSPTRITFEEGASVRLRVTDSNDEIIPNRLVTFTSATNRQTVDADGVVTAVTKGAASNVTASYDGASVNCVVDVN